VKFRRTTTTTTDKEGKSIVTVDGFIEYKLPDRQKAKIELGKRIGGSAAFCRLCCRYA
jgi:hypothetical protein